MTPTELYVSVDVETDGPIPGQNSMLSIGAAAFLADGTMIDTFAANLLTLPYATPDAATMAWWNTGSNREAYRDTRLNCEPADDVMLKFAAWVDTTCTKASDIDAELKPVFVGYPAGFDFTFVYWYLMKFAKRSPFGSSALDIKTLAMGLLNSQFRRATKRTMPKKWHSSKPHTHRAIDDAIEQGELFCNMLAELRARVRRTLKFSEGSFDILLMHEGDADLLDAWADDEGATHG